MRSYFSFEGLREDPFKRLEQSFKNPMAEVYLCFSQLALVTFTNFNQFLQHEDPLIYLAYDHMNRFMNKLASKLIKPDVLQMFKAQDKPFSTLGTSLLNQRAMILIYLLES